MFFNMLVALVLITITELPKILMAATNPESYGTTYVDNTPLYSYQCGKNIEIACVTSASYPFGEAPFYVSETQSIYSVDIVTSTIRRYSLSNQKLYIALLGYKTVGAIIPVQGNVSEFLVNYGSEIVLVIWDGYSPEVSSITIITTPDFRRPYPYTMLDDSEISPNNDYFVNSFPVYELAIQVTTFQSRMYSFDGLHSKIQGTGLSIFNGFAWSIDSEWIFFSDTPSRRSFKAPFDAITNTVGNRTTILDFNKLGIAGYPDSALVDAEDNLWIVSNRGFQLIRIDPRTNNILCRLYLPAFSPSNLEFAPCDISQPSKMDCLYVTTGSGPDAAPIIISQIPIPIPKIVDNITTLSKNGCLLRIKGTGASGLPSRKAPTKLINGL